MASTSFVALSSEKKINCWKSVLKHASDHKVECDRIGHVQPETTEADVVPKTLSCPFAPNLCTGEASNTVIKSRVIIKKGYVDIFN